MFEGPECECTAEGECLESCDASGCIGWSREVAAATGRAPVTFDPEDCQARVARDRREYRAKQAPIGEINVLDALDFVFGAQNVLVCD